MVVVTEAIVMICLSRSVHLLEVFWPFIEAHLVKVMIAEDIVVMVEPGRVCFFVLMDLIKWHLVFFFLFFVQEAIG